MVGFNFAPYGHAFCNGQLLNITQNTALYSLLGIMYGGNGHSTFALPDLRGRLPMHQGTGPGLTERMTGETGGSETVPLSAGYLGKAEGTGDVVDGSVPEPSNMMPYLVTNFVIALKGIFPVRE